MLSSTASMTHLGGTRSRERSRERILDAAVEELAATNVASFTIEQVAARSGISTQTIRESWPNSAELLIAALAHFGDRHLLVPDTGTFRGDLLAYARAYAAMPNSPIGRRVVDSMIIRPQDWDLSTTRPTMVENRARRLGGMVARSIARGECVAGTDNGRIIDMISIGLSLPVLFYDRPVNEQDCEFVVDLILNGLTPRS